MSDAALQRPPCLAQHRVPLRRNSLNREGALHT